MVPKAPSWKLRYGMIVLWEHYLDRILEGQIEGLRRKIPEQFVKLTRQKAAAPCSL